MKIVVEQLLTTKFYIPLTRPELVSRPRLVERLHAGSNRKLTLISAPAGFGKTTLVSEWVDQIRSGAARQSNNGYRIAWLSLDESDNDTVRFLAYLITALKRAEGIDPELGKSALSMLRSPQPPPTDIVLTSLINEIAATHDRIFLFLDDYHLIEAQTTHDALSFLLENIPPQMHLVIATREDPQLHLARLRAQGQMTELRAVDLRFNSIEADEFLKQVMGIDLSEKDIASLETRTEGWITGLQLAALVLQGSISMRGRTDASEFIKSFTGSHRYVLDYLLEEVLGQQSESIQTFLLQTAILDRLTGSLCDAVTGRENGQEILGVLERTNLFTVPLDEERCWYRYHHLFAELLEQRLKQSQIEQIPQLHLRASEWYLQNGFSEQAIEHTLHADDFERAADLVEVQIDELWGRGEHRKLQRWLDRLPEEVLFSRPYICIYHARYQCNNGQLDEAERTLLAAETALEMKSSEKEKLIGRIAATRALMCSYRGDVSGIIKYAGLALESIPVDDLTWRGITALVLGNAQGFKGNMNEAYKARYEAFQACKASGNIFLIMLANLQLAITLRSQGRLRRTIEICEQQWQFAREYGLLQTRLTGYLLAVWGETLGEVNDLDSAVERAVQGFELTLRSGDMQMIGWSFMCLIRVLYSRRDLAEAEGVIHKMEHIARETYVPPWIENHMAIWRARLWLEQDKLVDAVQWYAERGFDLRVRDSAPEDIDYFLLFDYLMYARFLIAQERLEQATRLLQMLLEVAEAGGRTTRVIEILILESLAFHQWGYERESVTALERALTLANPEGFVRIFVDEGLPMASLLYELLNRGIQADYVRRLLAAYPSDQPEQSESSPTQNLQEALIEPLSAREIEVLQLIAEGLTNPEIASRLYLSLNTVKVHTRNIYGKLGTNNRISAVARGRALGVLPKS